MEVITRISKVMFIVFAPSMLKYDAMDYGDLGTPEDIVNGKIVPRDNMQMDHFGMTVHQMAQEAENGYKFFLYSRSQIPVLKKLMVEYLDAAKELTMVLNARPEDKEKVECILAFAKNVVALNPEKAAVNLGFRELTKGLSLIDKNSVDLFKRKKTSSKIIMDDNSLFKPRTKKRKIL